MREQKEIRFTLPTADDYRVYEDFHRLCIVNGEKDRDVFARLMKSEVERNRDKLYDERGNLKWVDQPTLITRLAEQDPPIRTTSQTLYNYRMAGKLDGLFGSDGGKGLLYNLRGVIMFFREIQAAPRENRSVQAEA
jgi:hypothetical protein